MCQNFSNGELILNARDDLHRSAAVFTNGHVDQKNPFQSLRPGHGDMARGGSLRALPARPFVFLSAPRRGHDLRAQPRVDAAAVCGEDRCKQIGDGEGGGAGG
jgi:hypothetical protein